MNARQGYFWTLQNQALVVIGTIVACAIAATAGVVGLDYRSSSFYLAADQARAQQIDLTDLYATMKDTQGGVDEYITSGDLAFLDENTSPVLERLASKVRTEAQPDDALLVGALRQSVDAYRLWLDSVRAEAGTGLPAREPQTSSIGSILFQDFASNYRPLVAESASDAAVALTAAEAVSRQQAQATFVAAGISVGMLLVLAWLFLRSTLRPLRNLVYTASELAAGRPVTIPELVRRDEVGALAQALGRWRAFDASRLLISQTMAQVAGQSDLDRVVAAAVPGLIELLGANEVVISVVDPDGFATIAASEPNHYVAVGSPLPEGSPGGAALAWATIVVGDVTDPKWNSTLTQRGLGPVLSTPLIASGQVLGVATAFRKAGEPQFDSLEVHQAEVAGPFVAAAIHSGRLLRTLQVANLNLARADRQKTEFMATVTHELRTPLNSILGFSELMLKDPGRAQLTEKTTRFVSNINASGRRLLDVVNKIIELGQLESGGIQLDRSFVRLSESVAAVVDTLAPDAAGAGVELRSTVRPDLVLPADPVRLNQILYHLVSNGIRFTPAGGKVEVSAEETGDSLLVEVRDNGAGIAEADQARVFEKFERAADPASGAPADGTGLGLALTKVLVELHGGTISVVSALGAGSTFQVRLPRLKTRAAEKEAAA
jgi:signal transduction histidine kinase/HAMP domain-containing protein